MSCGRFCFLVPFLAALLVAGEEKVDGPVIGIDLGTTFSCVGIVAPHGLVEIIPGPSGQRLLPSQVAFEEDGTVLVGEAATSAGASQRIFDVKRLLGRSFKDTALQRDIKNFPFKVVADSDGRAAVSITVKGKAVVKRPEEISSLLLAQLKQRASEHLGREVLHAVISVPAFFDDAMRTAVKVAAAGAKLEVLRIINEPTAAALAYGHGGHGPSTAREILLVYDLGGGTCDVSILQREADGLKVLASSGDPHLGGRLAERLASHGDGALERLRIEAEKAKRRLSSVPQVAVKLEGFANGKDLSETLTRAQFEKLNDDLFQRTLEPVKTALKDSGLAKSDVNTVILAGGSARIPKVQQLLSEFFDGKENLGRRTALTRSINPDEVVAHGAALQAAALSVQGSGQELRLIDVTPLSLGIQTAGGFMTTVIKRNTPLPAENMMIFSTHKDNQESATVKVFQGERLMAKNNHLMGSFQIKGISPAPRGVPQIQVLFKVDVNGLVAVEATDSGSGKGEVLKVASELSHERIEEMIQESESLEKEDQKDFARAEAKMALKLFIRSLHHAAEMALEDDASTFLAAANEGADWLAANADAEAEEIHEKREELEGNVPELPTAKAASAAEVET
ncbi:unnamed protein product [Cladocopium goreaui]|uniref:Endoplasmic reticulum chaperone BiP (Immunoglobulin heavy chain-binding protein homolog) (BiP) n=1 Tax=Cladocopium goreaui TaxID=2562237 RepID=A0A9P1CT70_9DINO|nr:unnamed protein product [Cladocopium goreaui]